MTCPNTYAPWLEDALWIGYREFDSQIISGLLGDRTVAKLMPPSP